MLRDLLKTRMLHKREEKSQGDARKNLEVESREKVTTSDNYLSTPEKIMKKLPRK